jgi:hypothetical protein
MRLSARPIRIVSLLVLLAVVNVFVFASGTLSPSRTSNEAGNSKALLGKLVTTSNRPVIVNGGEAITGAIILSGAQVQTPAANIAKVQLDNLGAVLIFPKSSVNIAFDQKQITVRVASGNATLTTADGVKGVVLDANGDPTLPTPSVPASSSAKNWGIAGVAVGSAAFIWAIIAWNRANDARDTANAANAAAASLASQLAALRTCLAGQTSTSLCKSF